MNRRREMGWILSNYTVYIYTLYINIYIFMHEILFYFKSDFRYYSTDVLNAKALSVST